MAKIQVIAVKERIVYFRKEPQEIHIKDGLYLNVEVYNKSTVERILGVVATAEESKAIIDYAKKVNREAYGDRCKFDFENYNDKDSVYVTYGTRTYDVEKVISLSDIENLKDAEKINICGYRASDLVVIACRYQLENIDNELLADNNKAYIDGYNKAHEEIQKSLDNIVGSIGDANEKN